MPVQTLMDAALINDWHKSHTNEIARNCNLLSKSQMWVKLLIDRYRADPKFVRRILVTIIGRADYESFLNTLVKNYAWRNTESENNLLFMFDFWIMHYIEKFKKMIQYRDLSGNNVLHYAAKYHCEKIIRFIKYAPEFKDIESTLYVGNKRGHNPYDLYMNNSVQNILKF